MDFFKWNAGRESLQYLAVEIHSSIIKRMVVGTIVRAPRLALILFMLCICAQALLRHRHHSAQSQYTSRKVRSLFSSIHQQQEWEQQQQQTREAVLSKVNGATAVNSNVAVAKTLTDLVQVSREACDAVQPMLKAFYDKITEGASATAKLKSDATFFTIADGIVQHMFIEHLFKPGNKFGNIVGEEDETKVNIINPPYSVDELIVPDEFNSLIASTLVKIKSLSKRIDSEAFKKLTLFVDPIDGTREFATGQGEFVTILLGYNDEKGHPCAGIMYRPLTSPVTWAAGAKSENCAIGVLDYAKTPKPNGLLITDGKVSKFLAALIQELGMERIPSVASGNRAMMILEGKAGAYIRDTGGFAKWDTSGPQAVIEAFGGTMSKLPNFIKDKSLVSYTHLKSDKNLDFEGCTVFRSLGNVRDKSLYKKGEKGVVESDVMNLREYTCLQGLVCLDKNNMNNIDKIHAAMNKVMEEHPPTYT